MHFQQYFKSRQGEMVGLLKELVGLESPTVDKKAVDACSAFLADRLRAIGAKVTRVPQKKTGDFHLIEYPAARTGLDGRILVLTHIDTVWPVGRIAKMPFYVSGRQDLRARRPRHEGRAGHGRFGPLGAPRAQHRPAAEDRGLHQFGRGDGLRRGARRHQGPGQAVDAVLCLEPALPGGALKLERKGRLVVRLEARDRPPTAARPKRASTPSRSSWPSSAKSRRSGPARSRSTSGCRRRREGQRRPDTASAVLDIRFWRRRTEEQGPGLRSRSSSPSAPRGEDQGRHREPDPAHGEDEGLDRALRAGLGDRGRARARPDGRQDRRRLGRLDRLEPRASRRWTAWGRTATASTPTTSTSSSPRSSSGRPC